VLLSVAPDFDVVAFRFGVPYAAGLGHRGFSHSLALAAVAALAGASLRGPLRTRFGTALAFLFAATASHGVLDAFTNGGLGVAFLWPFSQARWFAPVRPIEVAPFGIARLLSARGAAVLASELAWVWAPCALAGAAAIAVRAALAARGRPGQASARRGWPAVSPERAPPAGPARPPEPGGRLRPRCRRPAR
jgi:inner membrane protein